MQLALKIDVDTLRGTREGVPALVEVLKRAEADATFLFSLGPDHTGRALRRVFRRGFFDFAHKVARTSVLEHYGLRTLLYGTLLPGPDIGRRAGDFMRAVRDAGYEVGVHCFDHTTWQDFVSRRGEAWTRDQMLRAVHRFREVFGVKPQVHGAAGWQMNEAALEQEEEMGFLYASDIRGEAPFMPLLSPPAPQPQRRSTCPQLPTTLPTLDELIGVNGITVDNVHQALLERTRAQRPSHVFTLHAELEGMKLLPVFRRLIEGWHAQGYQLVSMRTLFAGLDLARLPAGRVQSGSVPGRSGWLAVQGPAGF
ncbi:MAG TPA: polysaccharide deacetylase family protein [Steroidobacteraceae bacterium]|nr:polysaccharide deacetylase family protein [Steroidobacteraceae bacterium]